MQSQHKIIIQVSQPQLDATKNFITYLVSGQDSLGTFQIRRRYNDFFYFRQCLKKRWPGIYIPPIPQKKINISGQDDLQVQYRRKFFDYFLKQLATIKYLYSSPITQEFVRNQSIVMEKYFQTVGQPRTQDLIDQYKNLFPKLAYKQNVAENKNICNNFSGYLKKAQKQIKILSSELGVLVEARNNFLENLNNCNTLMLPEYEKNVYAEYIADSKRDPVLLFVQENKIQENIQNLRAKTLQKTNSFTHFYNMLVFEARQIQSFQQAIQSKQQQQNNRKRLQQKCLSSQAEISKLMGGKFSIKSIFSKGSIKQQIQILEKQIPEMQKQTQKLGQLCQILNCIQATAQIPTFKRLKQRQYYQTLNITSQGQLSYLAAYGQFLKSVMEGLTRILQNKN